MIGADRSLGQRNLIGGVFFDLSCGFKKSEWPNSQKGRTFVDVEHKGIEYQILQMANPSGWRWVVRLGVDNIKTGVASSKGNATFKAVKLIDSAIKDVKRNPPASTV
jgi:hypothetical protein